MSFIVPRRDIKRRELRWRGPLWFQNLFISFNYRRWVRFPKIAISKRMLSLLPFQITVRVTSGDFLAIMSRNFMRYRKGSWLVENYLRRTWKKWKKSIFSFVSNVFLFFAFSNGQKRLDNQWGHEQGKRIPSLFSTLFPRLYNLDEACGVLSQSLPLQQIERNSEKRAFFIFRSQTLGV